MSAITPPLSCDQKGEMDEKMYKCKSCGESFVAPVEITDYQLYDEPFDACPKCQSENIEEYEPCPACGIHERMDILPMCRKCALAELDAMDREGKLFGGVGRGALLLLLRRTIG